MRRYLLRTAASITGLALLLLPGAGLCTAIEASICCDGSACPPTSGDCLVVPAAECCVVEIDATRKGVLDGADRSGATVLADGFADPFPSSEAFGYTETAPPPPHAFFPSRYTLFASFLL